MCILTMPTTNYHNSLYSYSKIIYGYGNNISFKVFVSKHYLKCTIYILISNVCISKG